MAYQVVAGMVSAETRVQGESRATVDFPRGALLPEDVPAEQVESFLARGLVELADARPGPGPGPEPEDEAVDLSTMDKDELLAYADDHEIVVDRRLGADNLRAAIQEAE